MIIQYFFLFCSTHCPKYN